MFYYILYLPKYNFYNSFFRTISANTPGDKCTNKCRVLKIPNFFQLNSSKYCYLNLKFLVKLSRILEYNFNFMSSYIDSR